MKNQFHILRSKRFLPLFISQFFGAFNDNAFKNAFLFWFTFDFAVKNNINPATMLSLATVVFILPFFLFSATAGQLADKYEKSKLTQLIKLAEVILMIFCLLFFYLKSVNGLLIVLFFMGSQSAFFGPIKYSLLPEHLHDDELISGNGLIEGGTFLAILLGTIFGGVVISYQYGVFILGFAVIFFAIIGYISSLFIPKTVVNDEKLIIGFNIFAETKKVTSYAKSVRVVWHSIVGISWFWLIGATFLTQFPSYVKTIVHSNEGVVTLFLTIFSIGIGIGSVCCNYILKGKINTKLVPIGAIGISIFMILFCFFSWRFESNFEINNTLNISTLLNIKQFIMFDLNSKMIVLSLFFVAFFSGVYIVPLYAVMQHYSPKQYISRIIAANNVLNALFMVGSGVFSIIVFAMGFDAVTLLFIIALANIFISFYY